MEANAGDTQLFYKLIKWQQGTGSNFLATMDFGNKSQQAGWAKYYEHLATPVDDDRFNHEAKERNNPPPHKIPRSYSPRKRPSDGS